jgi:hypothetical protein
VDGIERQLKIFVGMIYEHMNAGKRLREYLRKIEGSTLNNFRIAVHRTIGFRVSWDVRKS